MELGIVAQRDNDRAIELAADLYEALSVEDVAVHVDPATADAIDADPTPVDDMAAYPLVVSVGGDGTFLYAARHVGSTPILGVNLGEVGFLNAVSPGEAVDRVREEVEHVRETGRPRFREVARLVARGEGWSQPPGLNEVVVQGPQRGHGRGIDLDVRIDGSTYTAGHADGVLIATPTGSTAYNLSEGGPLLHPTVDGLVVTGMSDETGMPSLVAPLDADIEVQVSGAEHAVVASDGRQRRVDLPAEVSIGLADEPGRIAGPRSDFFRALEKIERPNDARPPRNGKA